MRERAIVFAKTESLAEAAACLYGCSFGKGDLNFFYEAMVKEGALKAFDKLKLLFRPIIGNIQITNDKHKEGTHPVLTQFYPSSTILFPLWRKFVVVDKVISEVQFMQLYPKVNDKVEWWKRYTDENGNDRVVKS